MNVSRGIQNPIDLLKLALNTAVKVRLRSGETVTGTLKGYDTHVNLLLVATHTSHVQFIRGDNVTMVTSDTHLC